MNLARERECKRITLLTDFDDLASEKFYQKHGFKLSRMVPLRQLIAERQDETLQILRNWMEEQLLHKISN